jgi:DNA-binding NarL/FixJ family response regulator
MHRQRILLVDDHEVVRLGLKALIDRHPDMEVVAEAATATDAVTKALGFKPDVVILDIRLGGSSGLDACQQIMNQLPDTIIISPVAPMITSRLLPSEPGRGCVLKQAGG